MLPQEVDLHLSNYQYAKGRAAHLETHIRALCKGQAALLSEPYDSPVTHVITGMPRSGKTADLTAETAIRAAMGEVVPDKAGGMLLSMMQQELSELLFTIAYVEGWLSGLSERERWVIWQHLIDGKPWREIEVAWAAKFGDTRTRDHIRKIQARGMQKVYWMAV